MTKQTKADLLFMSVLNALKAVEQQAAVLRNQKTLDEDHVQALSRLEDRLSDLVRGHMSEIDELPITAAPETLGAALSGQSKTDAPRYSNSTPVMKSSALEERVKEVECQQRDAFDRRLKEDLAKPSRGLYPYETRPYYGPRGL